MDKYIGRLLDNRYEILEAIGTGGMAVVYKARCHRLNRLVAIKILKDDNLEDEDFRRRFHAESQAVAMLSHPNIVSVYDVSESLTADYIVMELVEGITLKQYMEKKGVLNWKETLHFAMQIGKALEHAHSRGIVHRDIKPHNVMVLKNGSVKVMDFGIARMMSKGNTLTKEALGSVHYISPEQAKGGRVDNRSDIYSLGVVMYEMMAGRPPYDGDSPVAVAIQHINGGAIMPSVLNPNIPGGLEQIIMKAMAHSLEDRYVSASDMLADMEEFRKDPTILFDYNVPPLDAVTNLQPKEPIKMPVRTTAQRVADHAERGGRPPISGIARNNQEVKRNLEERRRRRSEAEEQKRTRTATIAIISCSLVAIIAIVIFLIMIFNGGVSTPTPELVQVPQLVGKQFDDLPDYQNLEIIKEQVYDDNNPAGQVLDQNPKYGTMVEPGHKVVATVSLGPVPKVVLLNDLVNQTRDQAKEYLDSLKLGLTVVFSEENSDTVDEGRVIRTEPAKNTELTQGQTVIVWVSLGKKIENSSMPNVVDQPKDIAIQILRNQDMDLQITSDEVFDSEVAAGQVVRTEPEAGEPLQTGQEVKIFISKGPETRNMPNLVGEDVNTAYNILITAGFKTPFVEYVESDQPRDIVVWQSVEKNTQVDINKTIKLQVSKGPVETTPPPTTQPPEVTKDVVIDLRGSADQAEVNVTVTRDGVEVFSELVEMGTQSITIPAQTGRGTVIYQVVISMSDGWEETVVFTD